VTYDRVSMEQKDAIIKYLTSLFGPGSKPRSLKVDTLVRDEAALSESMYVEYEVPPVDTKPFIRNGVKLAPFRMLHSPFASTTEPGVVYMSGNQSGSIVRVDTRQRDMTARTKEWRIETPNDLMVQPHGIIERDGKVFFVELTGDRFDELDPRTGRITRTRIPSEGAGPHSVWPDSKGNFWFSYFAASGKVARINPKTGETKEYEPLKDVSGYGLVVDKADRVWMATLNTPVVLMHDPVTDRWKQFPVSNPVRRVAPDSKGLVWAGQFFGNRLVSIDPASGKVMEYEMPLKNGSAYDVWPDQDDNIWMTNHMYNSLVKFDQKTKKFTYYPYPQLAVYSPKIDRDQTGTLWFCLNAGGMPGELAGLLPKGNLPR
jgi:streptogramin lyase